MSTSILWFRNDLRLSDHPALIAASAEASDVLPIFVIDPRLRRSSPRRAERVAGSVAVLADELDGALCVMEGTPEEILPGLAREVGARAVHVTAATTPWGRSRDQRVAHALAGQGVGLVATGTPYAVAPGALLNKSGEPFQVFTPFSRAWLEAVPPPAGSAAPTWAEAPSGLHRADPGVATGGERAALDLWHSFREERLISYAADRDRPAREGTSRLSVALHLGEIHPRTLLADVSGVPGEDAQRFRLELGWRDFYAHVLWHAPRSSWADLRPQLSNLRYDEPTELIEAWKAGRTGFPFVDAGMRQLLAEGWMHNRLRMVTASFLVKSLHVWWPVGARHFLEHLLDGDVASNSHGWQWVAGTGTDAAPYFRIFNPVTQGLTHDPAGDYVRRWVPELRHLPGKFAHEPWKSGDGYAHGYPERCIDLAQERSDALARYAETRGAGV